MTDRRQFLTRMGAVGGAVALGRLAAVRSVVAEEINAAAGTRGSPDAGAYLLADNVVYLNHASIGTIPRVVHHARIRYLDLCETNPWLYMWGGAWEESREEVRARAAAYAGCRPAEMVFTHNTTEGFNVLAQGLPLGRGDEVLYSSLNHPGASICWEYRGPQKGYEVRSFQFPVERVPEMTFQELLDIYDREITPATRVLVFPHIDNIVGVRHPVRELTQLAHSKGVEFVAVDGAQSLGMVPIDLAQSGVDFYAASPHKWLQAPKGLGLMYVREEVRTSLKPMWVTWGQERWRGTERIFEDYGTRNLPEVLALGDAIDFQAKLGMDRKTGHYRKLWESMKSGVERSSRLLWRSPNSWELGSALFAIEVKDMASKDLFERLYRSDGFVFRAFSTQGLNTARISVNLLNTEGETGRFLEAAEKA